MQVDVSRHKRVLLQYCTYLGSTRLMERESRLRGIGSALLTWHIGEGSHLHTDTSNEALHPLLCIFQPTVIGGRACNPCSCAPDDREGTQASAFG